MMKTFTIEVLKYFYQKLKQRFALNQTFTGSGEDAGAGLVPAPPATAGTTKYLREDGTWQVPPNTDTHSTTHLYAGSGTASNTTTTNGNTKITVTDDSTVRNSVTIKGTGATTVSSDASGNITINSSNTTYNNFGKSGSGASAGLVPSPGTTAGMTKYLREDGTWQVIEELTNEEIDELFA